MIARLPNRSCRRASRTGRPGHHESFVAVSFPTCLQIIAAILERPAIAQILTHLGLHPQPRPNGRSARRPGPIARVARFRPSHARHKRPPHDAAARQLRTRSLGGTGHCIRQTLAASEFTLSGRCAWPAGTDRNWTMLGCAAQRSAAMRRNQGVQGRHWLSVWPAQGCPETPTRRIYLHTPSRCRQAPDAHGSLGRVRHHCRIARKALAH